MYQSPKINTYGQHLKRITHTLLSNTNARNADVVEVTIPVEATADQKEEVLKYLFLAEGRTNPLLRQVNPKLNLTPLKEILDALHPVGKLSFHGISEKVTNESAFLSNLCQRYKNRGFLSYDPVAGLYSITPTGVYLRELLNEVQTTHAPQGKKRTERTEPAPKKAAAPAPAPAKKKRSEEEQNGSVELKIRSFKRPDIHHKLLETLRDPGLWMKARDLYNKMGNLKPSKFDNFYHYYLQVQIKRGWFTSKQVGDHEEYSLTALGQKARAELAKGMEGGSDRDDDVVELSSSSGFEPKGKRTRGSESSSSSSSSSSDVGEEEEIVPSQRRSARVVTPALVKKAKKVAINPLPLEQPDDQPEDEDANEWGNAKLTLDDVPEMLREHLLGQLNADPAALANSLQKQAFDRLYQQLAGQLLKKFETGPGKTLMDHVKDQYNVTVTITKK